MDTDETQPIPAPQPITTPLDVNWNNRTYTTPEFEAYVRDLEARVARASTNPNATLSVEPATTRSQTNEVTQRPRHRLPHLQKFSGKRGDWQQWHISAIMKLKTDHEAIGSAEDQFTYLYMAMETEPQSRIAAWTQEAIKNGRDTPEAFLRQARIAFSDPNEQQNAHTRLTNMKQGREAFHVFLPKFEAELVKAGGTCWDDTVQVNYLRTTLNSELAMAIITARLPRDNYHAFKDGVLAIDGDLWALRAAKTSRNQPTNSVAKHNNREEDRMDWEPTRANNTKRVSQQEIEKRKEAGECIKCGRKGHFGRECRTGWRTNSVASMTKANQAEVGGDKNGNEDPKE